MIDWKSLGDERVTDNWVFRRAGLAGYGFSPFVPDGDDIRRVHGNDERVSVDKVERCHRFQESTAGPAPDRRPEGARSCHRFRCGKL